jgi:cation-transporting ATPase I
VTLSGVSRGHPLRRSLADGINLAVAAVPEGLPLLVSAAQLASTRRLAARGVHARNPRTIEALGRVDVLCVDKTGTLTEGEIKLARVADATHDTGRDELDDELRQVLITALRATPDPDNGCYSHFTDAAVAEGAASWGVDRGDWEQASALPFEPSRGYHAAVGGGVLCLKGAPEVLLPRCSLDDPVRRAVEERIEHLAEGGHRVLAVASRRVDSRHLREQDIQDLTFEGLLGLADVVRESAAPAIAKLREAGVQIVMLTGDHPSTAGAIATAVGGSRHHVLTGTEIDEMADHDLDNALPGADVVARCTPSHKVRVVEAFQRLGRVVAMTGDGANDAAGIRLADVGIALGGNGTPAAVAAADLVVADDRLETIVSALVEGRAMWASVREALAVLVGGNLGEIGFTLLGSLSGGVSPLSARQLLLVNMLTDLAPALAIAVRAPSGDAADTLLGEGPESSLGSALTRDISERAVVTATGAWLGWAVARLTGPEARARTVGLVALVGTQLAQTLAAGGRDRSVQLSAIGSWLALGTIVQTPFVSGFFGSVPLDPIAWAIALAAVGIAMAGGRALGASGLVAKLIPARAAGET